MSPPSCPTVPTVLTCFEKEKKKSVITTKKLGIKITSISVLSSHVLVLVLQYVYVFQRFQSATINVSSTPSFKYYRLKWFKTIKKKHRNKTTMKMEKKEEEIIVFSI